MAVADGFHVDTNGNLWLGSNRRTFDSTTQSEAKFYVEADGTMVAKAGATFAGDLSAAGGTFSGDISGASGTFTGDLTGADITGGTINIGSGTFQVSNAGAITATSGTIGGNTLGSTFIESSNYNAGSDGWRINSDGTAEFESVEIRVAASNESSEDTVPSGSRQIKIGAVPVYDFNGNLNIHPASGKSVIIHNGNPFVIKGETGSAQMRFEGAGSIGDFIFDLDFVSYSTAQSDSTRRYSNPTPLTQIREFYFENDNTQIFRANEQNADVEFFGDIGVPSGGKIYINGDDGNTGDFLKRTATGMEWGTGSSVSVAGSGDISVSESNNVYTVSHDDSDHSFASTSSVTANTNSIISVSSSLSTHENDSTAHGSFDNYGSWTLRSDPSGNLQTATISSGNSASIYSGVNTSTRMSGSTIYIDASGIQSIGRNGSLTGFVSAVSGSTVTLTRDLNNVAIYTGSHYPESSFAVLGASNDRWYRLYAQVATSVSSDERLKENIADINQGLDFINDLRPVEFTWKDITEYACEDYPDEKYNKTKEFCGTCQRENDIAYSDYLLEKEKFDNELIEDEPTEPTFTACTWVETTTDINEGKKSWGMLAQEVETTLDGYEGQVLNHDTENDVYG